MTLLLAIPCARPDCHPPLLTFPGLPVRSVIPAPEMSHVFLQQKLDRVRPLLPCAKSSQPQRIRRSDLSRPSCRFHRRLLPIVPSEPGSLGYSTSSTRRRRPQCAHETRPWRRAHRCARRGPDSPPVGCTDAQLPHNRPWRVCRHSLHWEHKVRI